MSYTPLPTDGSELQPLDGYTPTPKPDDYETPRGSCCTRLKRRKALYYSIIIILMLVSVAEFAMSVVQMKNDINYTKHHKGPKPFFLPYSLLEVLPLPLRCIVYVVWMLGSLLAFVGLIFGFCCVHSEVESDPLLAEKPKSDYESTNIQDTPV